MEIELSFIIVNYNSGNLLKKTVESVLNNVNNINYEIIIIDNNSNDTSLSTVQAHNSVLKFKLERNLGFAKANNVGAKMAKGFLLYFLNPDATIEDNNTSLLINDFSIESNLGIAAPKILNIDDTLQFSARMFPSFLRLFFYTYGVAKLFKTSYTTSYKLECEDHDNAIYPDWVSGAGFIVPQKLFLELGGFDEDFFLFYEDVDLCKRISDLGFKIKYNPKVIIKHKWGGSSKDLKEFIQREELKSRLMYFRKHASNIVFKSIKALTLFNLILRFVVSISTGNFRIGIIYFKVCISIGFYKKKLLSFRKIS